MNKLFDIDRDNITLDLKNIPGFSKYLISSDGRIWSKSRIVNSWHGGRKKKGLWLKQKIGNNGYLRVELINDEGDYKFLSVHRIVLMAWNRMPKEKEHCDHINNDRQDNRIENLRWTSPLENSGRTHSKYYIITYLDGKEELIFNLADFCRKNSYNRSPLEGTLYRASPYKGMKIREVKNYE